MKTMIVGSGVSGRAVYDYLKLNGIDCFYADEKLINEEKLNKDKFDDLIKDVDRVVVSPGISLKKDLIFQIKKKRIAFFGELEFGTSKIKNDIIAVTGTNGKTTTVSLIYYLLKNFFGGVEIGGNIGIPVSSLIDKLFGDEIVVLECSSFQLETIIKFRPHIAVILNITEDHLNRHKTIREYIRCKYKITKNQLSSDYLILNADDEIIRKNPPKTKAQILYFSTKRKVIGVYIRDNYIFYYDGECEEKLISISKIQLKGEHNLSNALAAILSVYLETKNKSMLENIFGFKGVSHRIEFVKKINGVEFYNDSKGTNIASTLVACWSFKQRIFLILGGSDKGFCYDDLIEKLPKNVYKIALFGENKNKIAFSIKKFNFNNYYICNTLDECVDVLFRDCLPGDVVLLSPASASFDQFSNYEERGNFFKKIVFNLDKNK